MINTQLSKKKNVTTQSSSFIFMCLSVLATKMGIIINLSHFLLFLSLLPTSIVVSFYNLRQSRDVTVGDTYHPYLLGNQALSLPHLKPFSLPYT